MNSMKTFDVYPVFNITPIQAEGSWLWDDQGKKYLDLYGGHAVISIGHKHPHYLEALSQQLNKISFYSNSVIIPQQKKLAHLLGELSGYPQHNLFLCNSGAEANENALKLASFVTSRKKVVAVKNSFHGRTSLAVAVTDDEKIQAPINRNDNIQFVELNDLNGLANAIDESTCAFIIEGIQGVGGIQLPTSEYLEFAHECCKNNGVLLILDEVQSGYGRTGKFFAHQHAEIKPDLITIAKGMGNGFPIAGVLINNEIEPKHGMLGTTFGGNYLACAAGIAVLEIIKNENLISNSERLGKKWINQLKSIEGVKEVRGQGLMIGIEMEFSVNALRRTLLEEFGIFTGNSSLANTIRLLPPLTISETEINIFNQAFVKAVNKQLIAK